jgi:hypothetical protein
MSDRHDERTLEALLRLAGPGPEPSAEAAARARAAVGAAWREAVAVRRRRPFRRLGGGLLAAGLAWLLLRPAPPLAPPGAPSVVATVERALEGASFHAGDPLASGTAIDTGAGRVALRTACGASLRLDARTRVRLAGAAHVALLAGALYFDSSSSPAGFALDTPQGRVTDEGTVFEARLVDGNGLRLRVREGRVGLGPETVGAGEELRVRDGGVGRARIGLAGPEWEWAEGLAEPPAIDGRPLAAFLEWSARERGLGLRFRDEATRALAGRVLLRGSVAGLTPAEATDAVALTSGVRVRVDGDRLLVEGER